VIIETQERSGLPAAFLGAGCCPHKTEAMRPMSPLTSGHPCLLPQNPTETERAMTAKESATPAPPLPETWGLSSARFWASARNTAVVIETPQASTLAGSVIGYDDYHVLLSVGTETVVVFKHWLVSAKALRQAAPVSEAQVTRIWGVTTNLFLGWQRKKPMRVQLTNGETLEAVMVGTDLRDLILEPPDGRAEWLIPKRAIGTCTGRIPDPPVWKGQLPPGETWMNGRHAAQFYADCEGEVVTLRLTTGLSFQCEFIGIDRYDVLVRTAEHQETTCLIPKHALLSVARPQPARVQ